jgi:tetratricopeptide (TPR) repeat protein
MESPAEAAAGSLRFGPWVALRVLSAGGSGVVYEARHVESGRVAAVKTLRAFRPEEQEALRREILALSRIDHPGVVQIYESGLAEGSPWYAMEIFRDPTLEERWSAEPRLALESSLRIVRDLAETLAFVHAEGIVHRDLKPANVMLRGGESPVLVDFGLVSRAPTRVAREPLERGGALVGTLAYISPEQIRGEHVDARADLYSLGCMLYECVAGRPPFGREGPEVVAGHLDEAPPPLPPEFLAGRPGLAGLVAALLEKDPQDRLGYAEDVARELSRLAPVARLTPLAASPAYLYRPHFVGRRAALDATGRQLDRALKGGGATLLVTGESGAGKTRLAQEATVLATTRGFEVVLGECAPIAGARSGTAVFGAPLYPIAPLLRAVADRCRHEGEEVTRAILGSRARTLVAYEPALAGIPGFDTLPEPAPMSGEAARARALAHLAESLRAFASRWPLLLVVDDLQWADEMTLAALRAFAADLVPQLPIVLLGTARSEEMSDELHRLLTLPRVEAIDLERLGPDEIASMVSDMLANRQPPPELVAMVVREAEGNPFFVAEYLRAAVTAGLLSRSGGRWEMTARTGADRAQRLELALPTNIHELVEQRLLSVPEEAVAVLQAGAVLGREFDGALAGAVAAVEEDEGFAAIATLVRRHIFEEVRGRLQFSHDKLREIAYTMVPEERRRRLHGRAADCIEERYRGSPELLGLYSQLGHHTAATGDAARAFRYFDLAGAHALEVGAYREAHASLRRAAELDSAERSADPELAHARRERLQSVAAFGIGDLAACIQHGRRALELLDAPLPRSNAKWSLVLAGELTRRALRVAVPSHLFRARGFRAERSREAALTLAQLATSFFFAGSTQRTLVSVLQGLRHGEAAGADRAIIEASMRLGFVSGTARLRPVSRHYFARAHRGADRLGDRRALAFALYFEAMHQIGIGGWARTRELGDRAAALLEEIGDAHEAEIALTISSHGFFYAGAIEEADRRVASMLATATGRAHGQHMSWGWFLRARTELVRGHPVEAFELARRARDPIRDLPDTLSNVMLEGTLALSALYAGEHDEARAACDRLLSRLARGERPSTGQCLDGLGAVADALLCMLESGAPQSELPSFERDLDQAVRALRQFARIFPIARAAAQRSRARLLHQAGRRGEAYRLWERSVRTAQRVGMPLEEARARLDLVRVLADGEAREEHRRIALDRLAAMGCTDLAPYVISASAG